MSRLLSEPEVDKIISKLVKRLEAKKVFDSIEEEIKQKFSAKWDILAKRRVGKITKQVVYEAYPEANLEKVVYVEEKSVRFENFLGDFIAEKKPYELFGGLGVYPDIAIRLPSAGSKLIYIELDNGYTSAKLKTALSKAAFGYIAGDCDYCLEIFHNRGNKKLAIFLKRPREKAILEKFEKDFHTKLVLFEENVKSNARALKR